MRALGVSAVLIGTLVLAGCGGGGGGSGGGGGGGGGGPQGTLTLSPTTLTFTTNDLAQTPASQFVNATINTNASGTIYLRIVSTGPAVANINTILITGPTTGQGTVVPAIPASLGPGSHTSTITVTACTSDPMCSSGIIGSPQTVAVTYNIAGVTSSLSAVSYTLSMTPVTADYTKTLPVVAYPTFTAASSVNWLSVSPSTGGSGMSNLALNLDQAAVDVFESGDHTATVTVTATGGNTLQVPVTLTVAKPQVDQVTPYVAEANKSATVIVRGLFLDQLPANGIDLSLTPTGTGIAPTNVTVVSPTELRLTHPALSANTYFVRMHDAQGVIIDRSTARLVVIEPTSYAADTLPWPADARLRNVQSLVYDDERKALLMVVRYGGEGLDTELLRYEYTSAWSAAQITPFPYLDALALSADGRDIIASSSPPFGIDYRPKLSLLSPTTLTERASLQTPDDLTYFPGLAVLNTNDVIAQGDSRTASSAGWRSYRYSVKRNSATTLTSTFVRGTIVASRDGQRVVAASDAGSSQDQSIYEYDAGSSDPMMRKAPVYYDVRAMSMDRTGDKVLIRGHDLTSEFVRVYDRSWNTLGSLSVLVGDFYLLAPDGTRAYIYGQDGDVHIYDLIAPLVAGQFQEIGTLTLAGIPDPGTNLMRMTISQDGRTLFLAGITQVVVQPLP
jgi:hypothetical protein